MVRAAILPPLLQISCVHERRMQLHMQGHVTYWSVFGVIVEVNISCRGNECVALSYILKLRTVYSVGLL